MELSLLSVMDVSARAAGSGWCPSTSYWSGTTDRAGGVPGKAHSSIAYFHETSAVVLGQFNVVLLLEIEHLRFDAWIQQAIVPRSTEIRSTRGCFCEQLEFCFDADVPIHLYVR